MSPSSTAGILILPLLAIAVSAALLWRPEMSAAANAADVKSAPSKSVAVKPAPDLSGRRRVGVASFYAHGFAGKEMANGAPMDPHGNNAASRTLPLGTTAKVTNLETGKSAVIRIEDRGPYVKGRIVDLSPSTARKIGITRRKGLSKVAVAPIAVPLPDGRVKPGAAARETRMASADRTSRR